MPNFLGPMKEEAGIDALSYQELPETVRFDDGVMSHARTLSRYCWWRTSSRDLRIAPGSRSPSQQRFVRPILWLLTLPLTVITLGLFLLILNAIMLQLTAALVPGFTIDGFGWAIVGALLLSIVSIVTGLFGKREERTNGRK
jgi:hypothetical protein